MKNMLKIKELNDQNQFIDLREKVEYHSEEK